MDRSKVKVDIESPPHPQKPAARRRLAMGIAALFLAGGSIVAANSAHAATVFNNMLCEPDTGWCYQTNPPYAPGIAHYCQWDYNLHNLHSGMWYTGCNYWGKQIG